MSSYCIDFWSFIISVVNLLVFIYFTVLVYNYNKSKDRINFLRQTPLISIEQSLYDHSYYVKNIGSGPALNIRILSGLNEDERKWNRNEIGFNLFGETNSFELNTQDKSAYLIIYNDIHKKEYYSYMRNNILKYGSIDEVEKDKKMIKILNYKRPEEELMLGFEPSV